MDRRDFVKLASGLLVSPAVAAGLEASPAAAAVIGGFPKSKVKRMAWTIDDGASAEAIKAYLEFSRSHYVKMSFFMTSGYRGWRSNEKEISRLYDKGLLQLANHTATHPDLTKLSVSGIQKELKRCHNYISDAFGVDARPYFRPPFGAYNRKVALAAAELGYTKLVMWNGTLADSSASTGHYGVKKHARQSFRDGTILLSHANLMLTPDVLPVLYELMKARGLNLVKVNEVI